MTIDANVALLTQGLLKIKSRTRLVGKDYTWASFTLNVLKELDIVTTDVGMASGIGIQK
jgi:hypothetical protein